MTVSQLEQPKREDVMSARVTYHIPSPLKHSQHTEDLADRPSETLRDSLLAEPLRLLR
jgi:hypothetical protein